MKDIVVLTGPFGAILCTAATAAASCACWLLIWVCKDKEYFRKYRIRDLEVHFVERL